MGHDAENSGVVTMTANIDGRKVKYRNIFKRFVMLSLICSLVPLLLVGWGINMHYSRFARDRMSENFNREVDQHRMVIELFLKEHQSKLQLIANTRTKDYLCQAENLQKVFEMLNREYSSLTDLGVINHNGRHLAYVGPYDLLDKNYTGEFWFRQVMDKGIFISNMFLGFRKIPHFIMAVLGSDNGDPWILRATIDTEAFRSLVENVRIGKTGEVYLLNAEGVYQTNPRFGGSIMQKTRLPVSGLHRGTDIRVIESAKSPTEPEKVRQIVCSAWLREPRWLLVVRQNYDEAFDAVNHANWAVLLFLHISALSILIVVVLVARYMVGLIRRHDQETDHLNEQLLQTSKLASIGELSAAVAHEINNPLAIISTERQILLDCQKQYGSVDPAFLAQFSDSLDQMNIQIQRCKRITHNLLRFSRRTIKAVESLDLNAFIKEVADLMEREARVNGIKFVLELCPEVPTIVSDVSQLQQVFLNLITNAIDAHETKSHGRIDISTSMSASGQEVKVSISDCGCGISKENLDRIFDPFFTTKPVGKGTGLGLSICHGIIKGLGGNITVHSKVDEGTRFDIQLPLRISGDMVRTSGPGSPENVI